MGKISGGTEYMKKFHEVSNIHFTDDTLKIEIDGKGYEFRLSEISKKLANATDIERNIYEISSSGYGIHWALIDEDLSIDGFLGIKHKPKNIREIVHA